MKSLALLATALAATATPNGNFLRIASATKNGETFTIGASVFEIFTGGATLTPGRVKVDLSASGTAAAASKLLTLASNPANNDTVTIDGTVYTYKTALTGGGVTANEILIGATLTDTRNYTVAAGNKAAGGGTTYGSATVALANVTLSATSTDGVTATAKVKGTAGNSIAIAESSSAMSWASAATALSGGVDPTAAETITAAVLAINSVASGVRAVAATGGVSVVDADGGRSIIACSETLAGTNNAWENAATGGGVAPSATGRGLIPILISRSPTALEVTLGVMRVPVGFTPRAYLVQVVASTGIVKAWGGVRSLSGDTVILTNNASADFAATDTVNIFAQA